MLQKYNVAMDWICRIVKGFLAVLIAATVIISFIEVFRRYFLGQTFSWSDEFSRFTMVYVGMVGGAVAYRYGELVCFDSLLNHLNQKGRFLCGIITDLFSLVLLGTGLVLGIQTIMSKGVRIARSSGLKLPMTVPYAAFVIGFALMVLFCLGSIANRIAKHKAEKSGKEDV